MMVVFSAMVLPSYPGMVRGAEVRSATRGVASLLRAARDYAIVHQRAVTLVYDAETHALQPVIEDLPEGTLTEQQLADEEAAQEAAAATSRPDRLLPTVQLPEGLTLSLQTDPTTSDTAALLPAESDGITFEADGSCPDSELLIEGPEVPPVVVGIRAGGARIEVEEVR